MMNISAFAITLSPIVVTAAIAYGNAFPRFVWFTAFAAIACAGAMAACLRTRDPYRFTALHVAMFVFVAVLLLTSFTGVDPRHSLWSSMERSLGVFFWIAWFGILLASVHWWRDAKINKKIIFAFATVHAIVLAWGFAEKFITGFSVSFSGDRIGSVFGNAIFFGMYLTLAIGFFSIVFAQRDRFQLSRRAASALIALTLVSFVTLLFTAARGALFGLFAGALVAIIGWMFTPSPSAMQNKIKKIRWIFAAGIIAAAVISAFFISTKTTTLKTRALNWKIAYNSFAARPIFGWGPENYRTSADRFFEPELEHFGPQELHPDKPHGAQIELLATSGIVGALAYLALMIIIFAELIKRFREGNLSPTVFWIWIGFFIAREAQNAFAFETHGTAIVLLFALGMLASDKSALWNFELKQKSSIALFTILAFVITIGSWIGGVSQIPAARAIALTSRADNLPPSSAETHLRTLAQKTDAPYFSDELQALFEGTMKSYWQSQETLLRLQKNEQKLWQAQTERLEQRLYGALIAYPDDYAIHLLSARFQMQFALATGDIKKLSLAANDAARAHELSPRHTEPLLLLSQIEMLARNFEAADRALADAEHIDSASAEIHWQRVITSILLKRTQDAMRHLYATISSQLKIQNQKQILFVMQELQKNDAGDAADRLQKYISSFPSER